jgi:hypothetical protein
VKQKSFLLEPSSSKRVQHLRDKKCSINVRKAQNLATYDSAPKEKQSRLHMTRVFNYYLVESYRNVTIITGDIKVKGKVVSVLNLIKHYAMKAYGGVDV